MSNIKLEIKHAAIDSKRIMKEAEEVEKIHNELQKNASKRGEFLGWLTWPEKYD